MPSDRQVLERLLSTLRAAFPTEEAFDSIMGALPTEGHDAIGLAWSFAENHVSIPQMVECPSCHADAGAPCRTKDGRLAQRPHGNRGFVDSEYCPTSPDHRHSEDWYDCQPCTFCGDDSVPESCDCGRPGHAAAAK